MAMQMARGGFCVERKRKTYKIYRGGIEFLSFVKVSLFRDSSDMRELYSIFVLQVFYINYYF